MPLPLIDKHWPKPGGFYFPAGSLLCLLKLLQLNRIHYAGVGYRRTSLQPAYARVYALSNGRFECVRVLMEMQRDGY